MTKKRDSITERPWSRPRDFKAVRFLGFRWFALAGGALLAGVSMAQETGRPEETAAPRGKPQGNVLSRFCSVLEGPAGAEPGPRGPVRPVPADAAEDLFETASGSDEDRLQFTQQGDRVIIDIRDRSGIGKATIRRKRPNWPASIQVRLHLSGLELFKAGWGDLHVQWWVSSGGDNRSWAALWRGQNDMEIDRTSPYFSNVRIVGGNGKVPLKGGYFEVSLPTRLLEGNPEKITLEWIDFYRR